MTVEALIELLEEVEDKTRDVKFNDVWDAYLIEDVDTESTNDVVLL